MSVAENEAWITTAVDDKAVGKAMTLAASLRRVRTARKLVALTFLTVSKKMRDKLNEVFDLVFLIETGCMNGWDLETYAKVHGFSLQVFKKCVYISPNALVIGNCDEMFGKYNSFAALYLDTNNDIDLSIYFYVPNLEYAQSLGKIDLTDERDSGDRSKHELQAWLQNNIAKIEKLERTYNFRLSLKDNVHQSLNMYASIINFIDVHPLDFVDQSMERTGQEIGVVEKFSVEQCLRIYVEDVKNLPNSLTAISSKAQYKTEPIAIVGMSFRLPGGNDVGEFWSLLVEGRNAVVTLPFNRWTKESSYFHCKDRQVEAGFLNVPIQEFDSKFFGLSPKEAEYLDPQQRLLLEVTWEALEDAMIDPLTLKGVQAGVFVGSWIHDYKEMLSRSEDVDFFRTYMGNSVAATAARLSHFLETTGPSIGTESGCSSAISAVDMACKSLRNGDSSLAVAAGVNLLLCPFHPNEMAFVLSPDCRCKTFDANANGFARAEGCAVLLLKRLSDAVKDADSIWGLIRGTAITQEGVSKSMGTPTVHCESLAMQLALRNAGVDPKDVSYIEAHGTGTSIGDPMEISAIHEAYSGARSQPLVIGSVKTNIGHTEAVSGITGIIKVLLSMKNELIPGHLNFETLNPNINLDAIPAQIPLSPIPWPRKDKTQRIAGVSSFGISGCDGHAIIEEPPKIFRTRLDVDKDRPLHFLKLSTKCTESMDLLAKKYLTIFKDKIDCSEKEFANFAYSANKGRATFNHRAAIIATNFAQAVETLERKSFKQSEVQNSAGNLCFLFTGQGSQYPSMAQRLYETSPVFRNSFDICDTILRKQYNINIKKVLWTDADHNEELNRTIYSQTSIFVVEYGLLKLWESWGVIPDYVLGHSLGEYTAAVAAGVLDLNDALKLVAERSQLIDDLPRGKMLVIKADKKTVDDAIAALQLTQPKFWVDCAALNSLEQTVVAGDSEMIDDFLKFCETKSLKTIALAATHAFHSHHMDPILEAFGKKTRAGVKGTRGDDLPKYISGMVGKVVDKGFIDAEYWIKHTREKVNFIDSCRVAQTEGCTLFVEMGPHPVLSALMMMNSDGRQITCLPSIRRHEDEWTTILESLAKLYLSNWKGKIDWEGFDKFYSRKMVNLPFYPFNRKPMWTSLERTNPKIHPLLGSFMPTASNEAIFQNLLTLKSTGFVQDHSIGNTVIFPGAGFLEMCLAGGHATIQGLTENLTKPKKHVFLQSLKILSPLALYESGGCKLQTVITLSDKQENEDAALGCVVEVHRLTDESGKWIHHASAKFLFMTACLPRLILNPKIDITEMQLRWERVDNKNFYQQLPEVGLRLGPQFQSLKCCWKNAKGLLASVKVPEDFRKYLIHPIVADAMIQAVMVWTNQGRLTKKLHVPVQIGEFIWLKEAESSTQFVHCSNDDNNAPFCVLLDEVGSPLAYMNGVDFIETTAKLVEGMATQQSGTMPQLWMEVWKNIRGPMQGYITHDSYLENFSYTEKDLQHFNEANCLKDDESKFYTNLIKVTRLAILKSLYLLGWKPEIFKPFSLEFLWEDLKIQKSFQQYIRFFFRSMAKPDCSMVKALDAEENTFQFEDLPPSMEELETELCGVSSSWDVDREEYRLIKEIATSLTEILTGNLNPLSILFPEDPRKPSAGKFYESCRAHLTLRPLDSKIASHVSSCTRSSETSKSRLVYRALEVGAGTGVLTKHFITVITSQAKEALEIEYYVTDVTAAFFNSAEKELNKHFKCVVFKKYDMEKDPLEQGLCPGYFDLITASEVFHIAKDIKKTMKSVRSLLKPGGMILFTDCISPDERITFAFGLLDGFWQFEDRNFRKNHNSLTPEMWKETLGNAGFHGISVVSLYNNVHGFISAYAVPMENTFWKGMPASMNSWIILGATNDDLTVGLSAKLSSVNRKCVVLSMPNVCSEKDMEQYLSSVLEKPEQLEGIIYLWSLCPNTRDQSKISLPFVTLTKLISELKTVPKTFAVMKGVYPIDTFKVIDPSPGTLIGFCKALANENFNVNVTCLDLDPNKDTTDQLEELFMNLWVEHKQCAAFRDGLRLCPRLKASEIIQYNEPLSLPRGCDRFQLVLPKTRLISDLEFAYLEPYTISEDEVEVEVKAMALNFRDVFTVLKPIPAFEKFNSVGLDFAGMISKIGKKVTRVGVGDRVSGFVFNNNLSLPSHYKSSEKYLFQIPTNTTYAEAVTLPAVFCTALYCLLDVAKMVKGDTVLLHTASGGVGLMAIQLCRHVGAHVIATAGSEQKRNYLRNLGIKHVFHSRSTEFKKHILEVTGGFGVDIVLNSLTGPGFKEASLDVLSQNGRFVEMSKLNVWKKEEMKALRPDVMYEIVDLTSFNAEQYNILAKKFSHWMQNNFLNPIPYVRFDALNIRGALNYLQKAKHIGKIVCIMPEIKLEKSTLVAKTPLFNEDSTYLVTGGLGGIGFEVVKWMLARGARHIAIISRSKPNAEVATLVEVWNEKGKHVRPFSVDVGNFEKLKAFLEDLKSTELGFPPLRGVMHAAGVLQDAVLQNQSWEKFAQTYNPKVEGSWNLHDLTKDYMLEHFVLFSSIAATFGSPGQTNHSASNSFEDSLAAYRRSNGLPATCINWGNWGEVGVATEIDFPGLLPISTTQGLLALETFLLTQINHMSVINVDSFSLVPKLFPQVKHYLDDCRLLGDAKVSLVLKSDEFWNEVDSAPDRKGKLECFSKFIKSVVRNILKMGHDEPIHDQTDFQTLGVDSLMMLEMKNGMQTILGGRINLTASQLKDCNNTEVLSNRLVDILLGNADIDKKFPNHQELIQLIQDDSSLLPDYLIDDFEPQKQTSIDEVKTVLLTGATGALGPFLLSDLTSRGQVRKVYCLIRRTLNHSGSERLKQKLEEMRLNQVIDMDKVEVIEGDITTPRFGLNDKDYTNLCEIVDAIIHSAVRSDHTAKYWKAPESNTLHVRTVNVLGTVRLLRFAGERRLKHFFHASTMLAFTGAGEDGQFTEGWQAVSAFDNTKFSVLQGYIISKHICEQLVHRALIRGIPCKVFRFPAISGDSKSGRINYQQNHAVLRWLTCLKIGVIHDIPVPFTAVPVDHCAKISLEIFFNTEAPMEVYNILQKSLDVEQVLVEVAKTFGIHLKTVSYDKFIDKLKGENENSPIAAFVKLYVDEELESEMVSIFENPAAIGMTKYFERGANILGTSKLEKYAPEYNKLMESSCEVLKRDFAYLKSVGVFEKYGIYSAS